MNADGFPFSEPELIGDLCARLTGACGREWTLLAPTIADGQLLLTYITPDATTHEVTPADAELAALLGLACLPHNRLATFRDLAFLRGRAPTEWAAPRALADRLIPPQVRARLHPAHRLFLAPDETLRALPWAALRLRDAWLCERAVLQLLRRPGRASLPDSHAAQSVPLDVNNSMALFIGCDTFGGRAPELPHALASLDVAAAHWPGPVLRPEAPVTRRSFLALNEEGHFERARLIHIASHARGGAHGAPAHLKLADGDVTADEVAALRLRGALVVLTVCSGAAGDEWQSLQSAFLAAGAGDVVASLWPIYGEATLRIFEQFYAALAQGRDPALALALAQRLMIAREPTSADDITASPFLWAGFEYTSAAVSGD